MKWLIKNGTIASEEKTFLADLLLEDDKIIKIDTNIEDAEAKCIDAEGCYVGCSRYSYTYGFGCRDCKGY